MTLTHRPHLQAVCIYMISLVLDVKSLTNVNLNMLRLGEINCFYNKTYVTVRFVPSRNSM